MKDLTKKQAELLKSLVAAGGRSWGLLGSEKTIGNTLVRRGLCEWRGSQDDVLHVTERGRRLVWQDHMARAPEER